MPVDVTVTMLPPLSTETKAFGVVLDEVGVVGENAAVEEENSRVISSEFRIEGVPGGKKMYLLMTRMWRMLMESM